MTWLRGCVIFCTSGVYGESLCVVGGMYIVYIVYIVIVCGSVVICVCLLISPPP